MIPERVHLNNTVAFAYGSLLRRKDEGVTVDCNFPTTLAFDDEVKINVIVIQIAKTQSDRLQGMTTRGTWEGAQNCHCHQILTETKAMRNSAFLFVNT